MSQPVAQPYTSPYHEFCREQRPLLPPLTNSDREKKIGQMWKELSEAGRAVYKQGLTQLASSGRGGLRAWAHPAPPEFGACGVLPSANRPALPTKLPAPPSAAGSAKFLAGCEVAQSIAIPVRASVAQLGGTYQTFVTQGGFRKPPMVLAQSTSSKARQSSSGAARCDPSCPGAVHLLGSTRESGEDISALCRPRELSCDACSAYTPKSPRARRRGGPLSLSVGRSRRAHRISTQEGGAAWAGHRAACQDSRVHQPIQRVLQISAVAPARAAAPAPAQRPREALGWALVNPSLPLAL